MLLPQEIAEQLGSKDYSELIAMVESTYHQAFGIVSIKKKKSGVEVVVELEDKTHHELTIQNTH